jgi:hypothetical protein
MSCRLKSLLIGHLEKVFLIPFLGSARHTLIGLLVSVFQFHVSLLIYPIHYIDYCVSCFGMRFILSIPDTFSKQSHFPHEASEG